MNYANMKIVFLVLLVISCLAILLWIFRPNSKKTYEEYSKIPLKDNEDQAE